LLLLQYKVYIGEFNILVSARIIGSLVLGAGVKPEADLHRSGPIPLSARHTTI